MYGNLKNSILYLFVCCGLFNCGRFNSRVMVVHKIDTVLVDQGRVVDSVFVFKKVRDTFRSERFTVYRDSDVYRYYFRERNCTTHIHRTTIQPERLRTLTRERRPGTLEKIAGALTALALGLAVLVLVMRNKR